MNHTFESINIGDTHTLKKTFTDADVKAFAAVSGDINPIHLDEKVAQTSIFKKRIVHGMLTASLFSAIFGNDFPGFGTIYLGQELHFLKPVYLDEEIQVKVTVLEKNENKATVTMKTECFNAEGKKVVDGKAELLVPRRDSQNG